MMLLLLWVSAVSSCSDFAYFFIYNRFYRVRACASVSPSIPHCKFLVSLNSRLLFVVWMLFSWEFRLVYRFFPIVDSAENWVWFTIIAPSSLSSSWSSTNALATPTFPSDIFSTICSTHLFGFHRLKCGQMQISLAEKKWRKKISASNSLSM